MTVMGVDPGVRGGVAVITSERGVVFLEAFKPTMTEEERVAVLLSAARKAHDVFVEKVGYMAGDGGQGAFTFGRIAGLISGALYAAGCRIYRVYPAMWQGRLDCLSGGDKNVTKARASQLFPHVKMTHAVADALLIAEYGRRVLTAT